MKVLQIISSFAPAYTYGGPARGAHHISQELAKRGHKMTVFTTDVYDAHSRLKYDKNPMYMNEIEVYHFRNLSNRLAKNNLPLAPTMAFALKLSIKDFDIVHLHEYRSFHAIIVHHYAKKYGVPYVLHAHGSLTRIMAKQRLKWIYDVSFGYSLLRDAAKVIAMSQPETQQYREMGVPEEKIEIMPNGIDLLEYGNLPLKGSFKKKFSIDDDEKIVLYLGRIHKLKGIYFLIKSFARLVENEDAKLVLAGADDGYLDNAKNLINSLRCSDHVLFVGFLSEEDKISAYVDSTIVVHPERFNVFGNVPLEAAACARPVIVCNENYMSKIVEEGGFGFSVNYGDVVSLNNHIKSLLNDQNLAMRLGQQGREFVTKNFTWKKLVGQLERVYHEVTESHIRYRGKK